MRNPDRPELFYDIGIGPGPGTYDEYHLVKFEPKYRDVDLYKKTPDTWHAPLFDNFEQAKQAILEIYTHRLNTIQAEIDLISNMTEQSCPVAPDPYC